MKSGLTDTQVRANVRSTLTQLRLDVQEVSIVSSHGVVRITGELKRSTREAQPIRATMLEEFTRELRRAKGVRRVLLQPINWRQVSGGSWVEVAPTNVGSSKPRAKLPMLETVASTQAAPTSIPLVA